MKGISALSLFLLLFVSAFTKAQQITFNFEEQNNDRINFSYGFRDLINSYTILSKINKKLILETSNEEIITSDDISRNTIIYAEPGDIINICLNKKGLIVYYCPNNKYRANESNFINEVYEKCGPIKDIQSKRLWFFTKKKINNQLFLDDNYSFEIALLKKYYSRRLISHNFYNYLSTIFWSLTIINSFEQKKNINKAESEILSNISKADNLIKIPEYRLALLNLINAKMINSKININLYNSLTAISRTFKSQNVKNYLYYNRVKFYLLYKNREVDKRSIVFFELNCQSKKFLAEIFQDTKEQKNITNLKLITNKYSGKLILLDFWASWCVPCRDEFRYQRILMKKFPEVVFLFLSIDQSVTSWKDASKEFSDILTSENNIYLGSRSASDLIKMLKVTTIPRLVLIGKDGKILDKNAPQPSDSELMKIIGQSL